MPYDPVSIQPFRDELTSAGFTELRTAPEVDAALTHPDETVLLVVNSVCGCAAGQARPGLARAVRTSGPLPDKLVTVFAGQDLEATAKARSYFEGFSPSSPSIALMKGGKVAYMLQRHQIQGMDAEAIARELNAAFQRHCSVTAPVAVSGSGEAAAPLDLPALRA